MWSWPNKPPPTLLPQPPAEPAAIVPVEGGIQIGQAYAAAHGTKCFTEAVAVVKDDVILAAYLDDFQFASTDAGVTAVPNFDAIQNFAVGKTISELEDLAAKGAEAVDAVSGATLVDTAGYVGVLVDAAK